MSEGPAKRRKTNDGRSQVTDPRFANIHSDPRYRLPSKKQKVKLDKRFKKTLRSDDFVRRAKVDRYGRPIENDSARHRLQQKFDLGDEEDSDEPDDDEEVQKELAKVEQKHDPLREGKPDASSSEDESSTDEDSDSELEETEEAEELETAPKEHVPTGDVSKRIAIVNLDWDNIRAEDLMAVFSSFLPTGASLLHVAVFPSEFGKERMEREEMEGPPKEIFAAAQRDGDESGSVSGEDEDDDDDIEASIIKPDDGSEFDSQALRQYQLEPLRYFFAVLTFSSKTAAKAIYDTVDGAEYLSTANFFDLRFVPDEMDFSGDKPRDQCHRIPSDYKPNEFVTDALQHSKVKLTWDQDDRTRKDAQARAFKGGQNEIEENDLKAYLGSDTSDDDEDDLEPFAEPTAGANATKSKKELEREKARALLGFAPQPTKGSRNKDKDAPLGNIQITFSSGLSGSADAEGKKRPVFENSPEPEETTAEKYIRKEKERKQKRKEKMKAMRSGPTADAADEDDGGVDQSEKGQDENLGFDDPFFDEANLNDISTKNKIRKEERLKKKREREAEEAASAKQRAELELLMAGDDDDPAHTGGVAAKARAVHHFDMAEIEKAERRKGKKDKFRKKHDKNNASSASALQDDFKMNVSDPRLGKLFENHEFAIDPTNQKLKQTSGMKELIDEGRKRKQNNAHSQPAAARRNVKEESKKKGRAGDSDVRDLVAKIKRRVK